jgi:ribonuclease HII
VLAEAIVGGDAKVQAISAASIIAKVHRDRLCAELHLRYPQYGFDAHKGYGTAEHLAALRAHGACEQHRRSYAPVRAVLEQTN